MPCVAIFTFFLLDIFGSFWLVKLPLVNWVCKVAAFFFSTWLFYKLISIFITTFSWGIAGLGRYFFKYKPWLWSYCLYKLGHLKIFVIDLFYKFIILSNVWYHHKRYDYVGSFPVYNQNRILIKWIQATLDVQLSPRFFFNLY